MSHTKESEYGRTEFKYNLKQWTDSEVGDGASQMNFRLMEGKGLCYYKIGVTDSGIPLGIYDEDFKYTCEIIKKMADRLSASVTLVEKQESPIKLTGFLEQKLFKKANYLDCVDLEEKRFIGMILVKCDTMIEKAKTGLQVREQLPTSETSSKGNLNICILGNVGKLHPSIREISQGIATDTIIYPLMNSTFFIKY